MEIKDSGERTVFSTGAQRDNGEKKGRFSLIPPSFLQRMALHMEMGAEKYEDRNWEKGMHLSRYVDAIWRHLGQWMMGDTSEPHLSALGWNVMCLSHTYDQIRAGNLPAELNDLPCVDMFLDVLPLEKLFIFPKVKETPVEEKPARLVNPHDWAKARQEVPQPIHVHHVDGDASPSSPVFPIKDYRVNQDGDHEYEDALGNIYTYSEPINWRGYYFQRWLGNGQDSGVDVEEFYKTFEEKETPKVPDENDWRKQFQIQCLRCGVWYQNTLFHKCVLKEEPKEEEEEDNSCYCDLCMGYTYDEDDLSSD